MGTDVLQRDGEREDGGASRDRTGDLYNAIVALSQLSYGPTEGRQSRDAPQAGQPQMSGGTCSSTTMRCCLPALTGRRWGQDRRRLHRPLKGPIDLSLTSILSLHLSQGRLEVIRDLVYLRGLLLREPQEPNSFLMLSRSDQEPSKRVRNRSVVWSELVGLARRLNGARIVDLAVKPRQVVEYDR